MPKKPPFWRQPSLFPLNPDDSTEAHNHLSYSTEGDTHAVQDHRPGTPETADGTVRTATDQSTIAVGPENYAQELRTSHHSWIETLSQAKPGSDPLQIKSEALEMALQELMVRLPSASQQDENETLPLDEAMAYLRNLKPLD